MESTRNKLIHLLEQYKETYISGQLLSEKLNISRSAVWKHMKELEKDGYEIEGVSKKGYRILNSPNRMSENTLQWGLKTDWLGKTIVHKEVTTSTQHIAHQLAQEGANHGTIVIADEQTNGKGRMNRQWHSSRGKGIWLSLILRPSILPYLAPQLTLLAATVLTEVIETTTTTNPKIKWPNDILIDRKKVAGILTELQAEQDQIQYVVIGMGINVNHELEDLPVEIQNKASSLQLQTKQSWDIKRLVQQLLFTFEKEYEAYIETGFMGVKRKWEAHSFKIGEQIRVSTLRDKWVAEFSGLADDGALIITNPDHTTQKLYSAEIDWFYE
ncbi:BirA family transcriptional regulator, biotin operon repressor / biotin-[acetyl-CoA-carboxylase] ligase [Oceanobacillus limi]|uniref:Bifunctional ligase/repressor BirA n=1 Tax=Oceanobacillus limi TaxID=930131 RepID=A0A1H9ZFM9_9BACI|nr:biotin--[acetyl-CoA-carboxylase] ligase [Oceanobacillus limi]SES80115.1 BirA family transcriptional regulator, biotin operon repressor / biotin-[acetyl-CoA-carboxylase] ligase [Oceanobacillus limi]